jgi:drug/metabolite transporter (DMT)-like permease
MDRRSWVLMWTLALVWGASYLFIKLGLEGGFGPFLLVFVRLALAAAVLTPIAARRGALAPLGRDRLSRLIALAAMQVAVPFVLITYGERHIASGLAGVLVATAPIFTAILIALGVGAEARMTRWSAIGVVVGMVGVALLFGVDLTGTAEEALGGAMVVTAGFGYAIGAIYLRRHFLDVAPVGIAAASMVTSALMMLPFAVAQLPSHLPTLKATAAVAALGLLGTGIAFLIFYTLIAGVGASKSSVVAYLAPGFALVYGAVFLSEPITLAAVFGLALILAGSWMAADGRMRRRRKPLPEPAAA